MSQRTFHTPENLEVVAGYDRPLRHFFLMIYDAEGEIVFNNLLLPNHGAMTLEAIQKELFLRGIEPPALFFTDLEKDQFLEYPESNLTHTYPRQETT